MVCKRGPYYQPTNVFCYIFEINKTKTSSTKKHACPSLIPTLSHPSETFPGEYTITPCFVYLNQMNGIGTHTEQRNRPYLKL